MLTTKIASKILLLLPAALLLVSCEESFTAFPQAKFVGRTVRKRPSVPPTAVRNILESFQINENRIIRTEDSRRMGAKFLNESETGSNRHCLIWCWETTDCNVAVYEEKSKGSCYLFDCGPPSAFLCLFTSHAFYTSSLLFSGPLEMRYGRWGLPSRHEDELTQLRRTPQLPTEVPQAISRQNESPEIPTLASTGSVTDPRPEARCQRYQFQCQNSSECIAVYNVCDGIPQCPDGSDESDDLNCPGATDKVTTTPLPQTSARTDATTTASSPPPRVGDDVAIPLASGDRGKSPTMGGQTHTFDHKPPPRDRPEGWSVVDPVPPIRRPDYNDLYGGYREKYNDYGVYADGGRLWVGDDGGQLYPVAPEGIPSPRQHLRPIQPSRYAQQDVRQQFRHQQILQQQQFQHQLQQQKQLAAMQSYGRGDDWKQWRHRPAPVGNGPETPVQEPFYVRPPVSYEARHPLPSPAPDGRSVPPPNRPVTEVEPVVLPTEDDGENLYEPVVEVGPPPDQHRSKEPHSAKHASKADAAAHPTLRHRPVVAPSSMQFGRLSEVANMRVSFTQVEQPGREANQESGSAVLALVLGLCVTGLLLVLVGCRLRLARHRLARRGGRSTLAHDADYLVNGMYL